MYNQAFEKYTSRDKTKIQLLKFISSYLTGAATALLCTTLVILHS